MSQLIGIVGESSTGKSTSLEKLDPKETFIINVASKPLPFKKSNTLYNSENKNYFETDDPKAIKECLQEISNNRPHIKTVVIDDGQYIMSFEFMRRSAETGYAKFTDIGKKTADIFDTAKKLRKDLKIIYITHSENVNDNGSIAKKKMLTVGQLLDNYINLEGLFTICLYSHVEMSKDGSKYWFITNNWEKYPAKSPKGMFSDIKIPNDLSEVLKKVDEYYN